MDAFARLKAFRRLGREVTLWHHPEYAPRCLLRHADVIDFAIDRGERIVRALRGEFDAVIAPYHDVGMTAIKVASFGSAVNITLGLPFVRTSPDHGTALDIAGQGMASAESLVRAMAVAVEMVERRQTRDRRR